MTCNTNTELGRLSAPRRNHFFYGKLLDEMHLRMEQQYFSGKRWLLNRLTLGEGVLCGLKVTRSANGKTLLVSAGVAIDALGREIVVPQDMEIDPLQLAGECGSRTRLDPAVDKKIHLVVCYRECRADFAPAMVTDCLPEDATAPSTIVESFCFVVRREHAPLVVLLSG